MDLSEAMINRFQMLELSISAERGPFALFGLFLRENAPNRWDVVIAAPWLGQPRPNALNTLSRSLREFPIDEQVLITQIAFVAAHGPEFEAAMRRIRQAVQAAYGKPEIQHGFVEMRDVDLFGQTIDTAYIITAQTLGVPVAV